MEEEEDATEADAVCDAETTCTERCRTKGAQRPRARGERAPAEPRPHYCPYRPPRRREHKGRNRSGKGAADKAARGARAAPLALRRALLLLACAARARARPPRALVWQAPPRPPGREVVNENVGPDRDGWRLRQRRRRGADGPGRGRHPRPHLCARGARPRLRLRLRLCLCRLRLCRLRLSVRLRQQMRPRRLRR